jgi:GH24 family phage-related lysozyme (muramidase)
VRNSVREAFYAFNEKYEGAVPFFYQDVLGLVSIGVGILADPIQLALNLPMVHPDGTSATRGDIAAEWAKIKALGSGTHTEGNLAAKHGHNYARPYTKLRMTDEGLLSVLLGKLHANDVYLKGRFPDFEEWPAEAQLAIHSLAWGCGPAFRFPKLEAALKAKDFVTASGEVRMVANGVELYGLKPRNKANKELLLNAAKVVADGLDYDVIFWPGQPQPRPVSVTPVSEPIVVDMGDPESGFNGDQPQDFRRFDEALEASTDEYRRNRD